MSAKAESIYTGITRLTLPAPAPQADRRRNNEKWVERKVLSRKWGMETIRTIMPQQSCDLPAVHWEVQLIHCNIITKRLAKTLDFDTVAFFFLSLYRITHGLNWNLCILFGIIFFIWIAWRFWATRKPIRRHEREPQRQCPPVVWSDDSIEIKGHNAPENAIRDKITNSVIECVSRRWISGPNSIACESCTLVFKPTNLLINSYQNGKKWAIAFFFSLVRAFRVRLNTMKSDTENQHTNKPTATHIPVNRTRRPRQGAS